MKLIRKCYYLLFALEFINVYYKDNRLAIMTSSAPIQRAARKNPMDKGRKL